MGEDTENTIQKTTEQKLGVFTFNGEPVPIEKYIWIAVSKDGTTLTQFDEATGLFHRFAEINQSELHMFIMQSVEDNKKCFHLHFKPDMKLIHYYRNVCLNFRTSEEKRFKLYCFGYERNGEKVILSIWPDGEVSIGETHPL